mmetsp:Transcript_9447/g.18075  ORF Transcript_9447/g.18075 Transcript_9447/m.18075 type:complete len:225 (-) Transcript_9447:497-1171(-)|eukprot:scaffold970_cov187-Amphora_coffeaeformis.AAC.2
MSVSRNDLLGIQGIPGKFRNGFGINGFPLRIEMFLEFHDPFQDFLIGQTVERTGQGIQTSGIRQVGIRQGGADQVRRVRRSIATLMIGVNAQVQPHEFVKGRVIVPQHARKVTTVIQTGILGYNTIKVDVAINNGGQFGQLGNDIQDIFQHVFMVRCLGDTLRIGLVKGGFGLTGLKANHKLRHGMHILGQAIHEGTHMRGQLGSLVKFGGQTIRLFLGGYFGR